MEVTPTVLPLEVLGRYQASEIGQKAVSLAQLQELSIPTPRSFVIPHSVLTEILEQNHLDYKVTEALQQTDWPDPNSIRSVSQTIQNIIRQQKIDKKLASSIMTAYHDLIGTNAFVAIRTSYPELSHLSHHNAILNVQGDANLLDSMLDLWSQEFATDQLIARFREFQDETLCPPSILVQEMVNAQRAGLAFSRDPDTSNKKLITVYAVLGIADHIQEHSVFDRFNIDITTGQVVMRDVAIKKHQHVRRLDGVEVASVPKSQQTQPALSDTELVTLAQLVQKLKLHQMTHLQVEWASDKHGLQILNQLNMAEPAPGKPEPRTMVVPPLSGVVASLAQVYAQLTSEYHPVHHQANNLYLCPQNADQTQQLAVVARQYPTAVIAYRLWDEQHGAIALISNHHLLESQLDLIADVSNRSRRLQVVIPLVRTPHELGLLKHAFHLRSLWPHPQVSIYMEISTPENIYSLPHYLKFRPDSFLVNTVKLEKLLLGKEQASENLYTFDSQLVKSQLTKIDQYLPDRSPYFFAKMLVQLPSPNLELIQLAVAKHADIIVKPNQVKRVEQLVTNLESRLF